jgi:MFS family permease
LVASWSPVRASAALLRTRATAGVAVFILGLLLSGTGGLLTGLAPLLGLAALAQAVAGSGNGLEVVATDTLVQRSVPRSHRGRVFGVVSAATLLGGTIARAWMACWSTSPPPGRPS